MADVAMVDHHAAPAMAIGTILDVSQISILDVIFATIHTVITTFPATLPPAPHLAKKTVAKKIV